MIQITLIGNPNTGKTTLFNQLTGLKQKTGNYPGVTVERKEGSFVWKETSFSITDLPGTYSIYPSAKDEEVVYNHLSKIDKDPSNFKLLYLLDAANLKRSLLFLSQLKDMGFAIVVAANLLDETEKLGQSINLEVLSECLDLPVIPINARTAKGLTELKDALLEKNNNRPTDCFKTPQMYEAQMKKARDIFPNTDAYALWQFLAFDGVNTHISNEIKEKRSQFIKESQIIPRRLQVKETLDRYVSIKPVVEAVVSIKKNQKKTFTELIDNILTHRFWGYVVFFSLLLVVFQAVFSLAKIPMDLIEDGFSYVNETMQDLLPKGPLSSLLTDGLIMGIKGIVVFVPQISILFFFLVLMDEIGYMSRAIFLMDRLMRPFGLSGKSVVPLISGAACAIPAVMSARGIENDKERLITILVTPFMTCSARIPVYTIIIGLIIPNTYWVGLPLQGLALMGMYLLGLIMALFSAWLLSRFLRSHYKRYLVLEMPSYKIPTFKNVFYTVYNKTKSFVIGAGKIILAISIILWGLSRFSPNDFSTQKESLVSQEIPALENSYLGLIGKTLEPLVKPLGYDWKIAIALVSSFAAREVFVGTLFTVYHLENPDSENKDERIQNRMRQEKDPKTGLARYNLASGISLLLFYAFAMQCMSTIAIVHRETQSLKWVLFQFLFMTLLAYTTAFFAYHFLKYMLFF